MYAWGETISLVPLQISLFRGFSQNRLYYLETEGVTCPISSHCVCHSFHFIFFPFYSSVQLDWNKLNSENKILILNISLKYLLRCFLLLLFLLLFIFLLSLTCIAGTLLCYCNTSLPMAVETNFS